MARLRDDPDLGTDLFAFLGLPTSATARCCATRIERIGEVNRRRRPDRERALTDELLAHARKLLVDGDPAEYLAGFDERVREVSSTRCSPATSTRRAARGRGRRDDAAILRR